MDHDILTEDINNTINNYKLPLSQINFTKSFLSKKGLNDLNKEIFNREKIVTGIKKIIESQYMFNNENQNQDMQMKFHKKMNRLYKSKLIFKKIIRDSVLKSKINLGSMALFAIGKRRNSVLSEKFLSTSKNFVLSPFKDNNILKKEKLLNNNKRGEKKFFTQKINDSYSSINKSNLINNNDKNKNYLKYIDKGKNNNENMENSNLSKNIIFNNTFYNNKKNNGFRTKSKIKLKKEKSRNYSAKNNNIFLYSNLTTGGKISLNKKYNKIINDSDISQKNNNYYLNDYLEKKRKQNFFNSPFILRNNSLYSNSSNTNSNLNYENNTFTLSKLKNDSSQNNKNYDYIFSYENNKLSKNYSSKHFEKNKSSANFKKIKNNALNNYKSKSHRNIKKLSSKYNSFLNDKVNSLDECTRACNTELIKLIDTNQKNNNKNKNKDGIDDVKIVLDVRNDVIDNESIEKSNKRKIKKYKILMNDLKLDLNLADANTKKTMNMLAKKINIISDSIALNMVEKCLGIKKDEGFDIDELFYEHIKRKNYQKKRTQNFRKKAEDNYKKMVKLRYTLSKDQIKS